MPIYDYVCVSCGHEVEVIHSVTADGPAACPKCGGQMKKAIVAPAVHFKGSGWARKEKSGSSKPVSRTASAESSSESTATPDAGAEKPAAPAEPAKQAGSESSAKDHD
ncbi:MAG TPA: FmdB family zinc ribbon protein [Candidatus Limnocylindrales bacterium]